MIVNNIDYSTKHDLLILTIDAEKFFVSYDFYKNIKISSGQDIDFDTYKKIIDEDQYQKAKIFALSKLSYGQKTSFELIKLLKNQDFDNKAIDKTISFLDSYKLIDDEGYVKSFINDKSNISKWSKNKIRYNLKAKKIDDNLIEKYLPEISDHEEYNKAYNFAIKKANGKIDYQTKQKVYRYLSSKGFDYDTINRVIGEIF